MSALDYQVDFNGIVIGDGTAYEIMQVSGLEDWSTRGSDVPIPNGYGNIPGSSFVNASVVVFTVESVNPPDMELLVATLTPPANAAPDVLVPVRYKYPNSEERLRYGRCSRRSRVRDVPSTFGKTQLTFEVEFPDPRAYSAVLQQASLTVFVAGSSGGDLTVSSGTNLGNDLTLDSGTNLGFDLTGTSSSGLQTITNLGYVDVYPLIVFSPATGISAFSVTNLTTGQVLTINQTVNTGQTLIADMQAAQNALSATGATGVAPIAIGGSSVYGSWRPPRIPLRFVPGSNLLKFDVTAGDTAASALVTSPSGYL